MSDAPGSGLPPAPPWVDDASAALLTDLYELTMLQAYWAEGMHREAVFSLFVRRLPERRSFLLAAGLESVLRYLETLRFSADALAYLRRQGSFRDEFLAWLGEMRFEGDVWAVPEGTPVFAEEPILELRAPLPVAQLAETFVMNQVHLQTVLASKAVRLVLAAQGRPVVDFGLRRMHGADAGLKAARAFHIAGIAATSNVLAGRVYGVPISGTMAHSYIQAHDDELEAFRTFAELYPDTVLLVDTYDTLEGVRKVVRLAEKLGEGFRVRGVRLDSGDLDRLARESRRILDEAGLGHVQVLASGGLDEDAIGELVDAEAPIAGFGVGTKLGVSDDAPGLDIAYKLVEYAGEGRLKLSPGKRILPGRKQVWRAEEEGRAVGDTITGADESAPGRPLLRQVMAAGRRTQAGHDDLDAAARRARQEVAALPEALRRREPADPPYPVRVSEALRERHDAIQRELARAAGVGR